MRTYQAVFQGVVWTLVLASLASAIALLPWVKSMGLSPLVIGIVLGMLYTNLFQTPHTWEAGIHFSAKKLLRLAIVLYGFRITFGELVDVGMDGFVISLIMVGSTFVLGNVIAQRWFGLDRDTAMLISAGAAVCGAAAVLATEPIVRAQEHKVSIAVSMVVVFGTVSMVVYPLLYSSGILGLDPRAFGLYIGGSVHEVAQVVAIAGAYDPVTSDTAVIVKMTRVLMIAPFLILLGWYLSRSSRASGGGSVPWVIPWFAVYFILMAGINSLLVMYVHEEWMERLREGINAVDTFILTMAMSALGMGSALSRFRGLGLAPLYSAAVLFGWLVVGGYCVTSLVVQWF